jgi:predicted RNase H-like HicB family nuclease
MARYDQFDGFTIKLYQDDDGDYLAHFVEMPNISAIADSPELAIKELAMAWSGVKESYIKRGETIPSALDRKANINQVNIRMDRQLHHALARQASLSGISLDTLVSRKLAESA